MNKDQLARRLLATFAGELEEQVRTMNADLLALEATPGDAEHLKSLFRVAHTLKGAARAAGVPVVEQVCHALEARLADARDGMLPLGREELALLFSAADALADAGQRLNAGRGLEDSPLAGLLQTVTGAKRRPPRSASTHPTAPAPTPAAPSPIEPTDSQVRVDARKLDALVASTGQLLVVGGRLTDQRAELEALHEARTRDPDLPVIIVSGRVGEEEFLGILRGAAQTAGRTLQMIWIGGAGPDHPVSSLYPEGRYLKAVFVLVL